MKDRPIIEYPEHLSSLSHDFYYHKISAEAYRRERRRIIEEMEEAFNKDSYQGPSNEAGVNREAE